MYGDLTKNESEIAARAAEQARFLKVLGNPGRLRILQELLEAPKQVCDLEKVLGLEQAYVSQQLARLRADGLVTGARNGRTVLYRIVDTRVEPVLRVPCRFQTASQSGRVGKI